MKKGTRSFIALLSTLLFISVVLAACSGGGKNEQEGSASSNAPVKTSEAGAPTADLPPYVIDWYVPGTPQPETELIEAEINKIVQPILNVTVKLHIFDWGSYDQRIATSLATNEKVDLFWTNFGSISKQVARKALVDLTDMLPKDAPDAAKVLAGSFLEGSRVNGRNYGIPVNKEKGTWIGGYARKDIVDELQFDINSVQKIEDLEPYLKMVKEKYPDMIPLLMAGQNNTAPYFTDKLLYNRGAVDGTVMAADGSGFIQMVETPELENYLRVIRKYYQAGYIPKDAHVLTDAFPQRKNAAFFFGPGKPYGELQVQAETGNKPFYYHAFGSPVSTGNDLGGSMMAITNGSKDPSRVLQFYNLFYKDARLVNLIDYGIEGKHYVKVDEQTADHHPNTEGGTKSGFNLNNPWMFGNQFLSFLRKGEPADKWAKFDEFNKSAEVLPGTGFIFDSEPVKTQVAAVENVWKEYWSTLSVGAADVDAKLAEFKNKLNASGMPKVIEEMNKQYQAFKTSK